MRKYKFDFVIPVLYYDTPEKGHASRKFIYQSVEMGNNRITFWSLGTITFNMPKAFLRLKCQDGADI